MSRSQVLILAALGLLIALVCLMSIGVLLVRLISETQVAPVIQSPIPSATATETPAPIPPTNTNTLVVQSTPTRSATATPIVQIDTPAPTSTKQKCRVRMGSTYILVDCDQLD